MNKPEKCPKCGGEVVRIVYGMPGHELALKETAGELVLGGCCVEENSPAWQCLKCKKTFGRYGQDRS